jgi:hypothetical protein
MERKPGRTATISTEEAKAPLSTSGKLTGEEEKVVRMHHGMVVDASAPLAKAAGGSADLADQLLMMEMDLFRAQRKAPAARAPRGAAASATQSADPRAKSKIIRALRWKR